MTSRRRLALVPAIVLVILGPARPAVATHLEGETVEISVGADAFLVVNGRHYRGPFTITAEEDGVAVVERATLDTYLEGIREVPFDWESDALKAQVVAARTYLAWTLSGGRSETGRRIGYDICATAACQVYAGVEALLGGGGDRWRTAVAGTTGEILVYDGGPARAYYSSTTGGRTRNIEDIWPGSDPAPYLVGVPSPGEESPFVSWSFELSGYDMHRLLREAGVATGRVQSITTRTTDDGGGPWMVDIVSDGGTVSIDTWSLRGKLNEAASIMPDLLPASNENGRTYPTTVLSPQFEIRTEKRSFELMGISVPVLHYVVEGAGWGHLIGMSQFGAQEMAEGGADYAEILAHYFGGLTPIQGGEHLPDQVSVGLIVGAASVTIDSDSFMTITLDGETLDVTNPGAWTFDWEEGRLRVVPPVSGIPLVRWGRL